MLITNGMPRCSATCAIAVAAPESNGPTSTCAPSWIRRSARVRAVSTFDSQSAFISSMSTPSISLITPGARSAPFWHDWPINPCTPERGRMTPTLSFVACARTMPNGVTAETTPAAASVLLNCLRFMVLVSPDPEPAFYASGDYDDRPRRAEGMATMNVADLVAIDIHTHAEVSTRMLPDEADREALEARGRYFRYKVQHPTIAQMAAYYRARRMA